MIKYLFYWEFLPSFFPAFFEKRNFFIIFRSHRLNIFRQVHFGRKTSHLFFQVEYFLHLFADALNHEIHELSLHEILEPNSQNKNLF
jgi:hypothetical protein